MTSIPTVLDRSATAVASLALPTARAGSGSGSGSGSTAASQAQEKRTDSTAFPRTITHDKGVTGCSSSHRTGTRDDSWPGWRAFLVALTLLVITGCSATDGGSAAGRDPVDGSASRTEPGAMRAVDDYRAYVQAQAERLVPVVEQFVAAVKSGDVDRAKSLYAPSRVPWEAIEPVAETFGDLDPRLDLRAADLAEGEPWTGWHRLEKALWVDGSTQGLDVVADQLVADVADLRRRVPDAELSVASIGNGAKELVDEVATGKITGEEEAFSHTDLVDFAANVDGAEKAFSVLRPLVDDGDLVAALASAFAAVRRALQPYARGEGYVRYDTVGDAERRELARVVDALGEPLSRLSAAAAG